MPTEDECLARLAKDPSTIHAIWAEADARRKAKRENATETGRAVQTVQHVDARLAAHRAFPDPAKQTIHKGPRP